jgi:hypothetical protein
MHSFFFQSFYGMAMMFLSFFFSLSASPPFSIAQTLSTNQKKAKKKKKEFKNKIDKKKDQGERAYCMDGETNHTLHGGQVKRRMFRRGLRDDESWVMTRAMAYNQN